jgi:Rod binding domain-containing protein
MNPIQFQPSPLRNNPNPAPPDQKLNNALQDFETLFASTLLRTAREESGSGWLGSSSGAGNDGIMEFAEQHIARALSSQGALGIAKTIQASLAKRENETQAPDQLPRTARIAAVNSGNTSNKSAHKP